MTTFDDQMQRYVQQYREPGSEARSRSANAVEALRQRLAAVGKEIGLIEAAIAAVRDSLAGTQS